MPPEISSATPPGNRRRWYQFSLRTLITVIVLISVLLGVSSVWRERGRRQARSVATIRAHGGNVTYDFMSREHPDGSISYGNKAESSVPTWLMRWLGVDCFHDVVSVHTESGRQPVWDAVGEFPELTQLSIRGPNSGSQDVSSLAKLRRLRSLSVSGNAMGGADLRYLQDASDLEVLSIYESSFDGQGFEYLTTLPKLEHLNLPYTKVGDEGLASLVKYPNLKFVSLSNSQVTDVGVAHLAAIPKLTFLSLQATSVTDVGMQKLGNVKGLRSLDVRGTNLSDEGLKSLEGLDHLGELDLEATRVTGEGIRWPKSLYHLNLRHTRLSEQGLMSFDPGHKLRIMVFGTDISDQAVERIARERPGIVLDYSR